MELRIGHGYDVHRFEVGRKLILGGVEIPFEKGLLGHSDADCLAHAIIDALFGAAAMGDIGGHFPDSDEIYRGAPSMGLLAEAAKMLREVGYEIANIDATIVCERPRMAPHVPAMRENIAAACDILVSHVSVKATTEEGLGFTGSGEGIACHAVALIRGV